jgi:two-component system, sporulation sensor kinase D
MINAYQNKRLWKYILLAFALIIASGSLFYTSYLARNIAKSERTRAQVWSLSIRQVISADDNDFLPYVFAVRDSSIIPAIVTDEKGELQYARGLDSTKTFNPPLPETEQIKTRLNTIRITLIMSCRS